MNSTKNWNALVLSGPSGVGKGTLTKKIFDQYPNVFEKPITYTTRKPREGEQHGREYYFVSHDEFHEMKKNQKFLETVQFNNNCYGSTIERVQNIIKSGKICFLEIHIDSGIQLKSKAINCHYIYLLPPDMSQLESRLHERQTKSNQSQQQIQMRLRSAQSQISKSKETSFYTKIVNDKIQTTVESIIKILGIQ